MSDIKKMLNALLDEDGHDVLLNGGSVVDPATGASFSAHMADDKRHLTAADPGKVLMTTADGHAWVAPAALGLDDAMHFKGTLGTDGTIAALPASGYRSGDTYKVITAGVYAGQSCEAGDLIMAITDATAGATEVTEADWTVAQTNIDGAVTGPAASVDAHVAVFDGATGKRVADSGYTLGVSVPADAVFHSGIAVVADANAVPVYNGKLRLVVADYTPPAGA